MPYLTDKQRRAVDRYHESKRNEAQNEIMRQAVNVVNREYFGMPSDDRLKLPQRLAIYSGRRHEAREENKRQALNIVNSEHFGMPPDDRRDSLQRLAVHSGQKNKFLEVIDDIERKTEEAVAGIGRLRGEIRRHELGLGDAIPTEE